MDEVRPCYRCDYETSQALTQCPQCGQPLRTAQQIRSAGWVLIASGGFLIILMGWVTISTILIIFFPEATGWSVRFNAGMVEMIVMYSLFYAVLAFGFASLIVGIWQVRKGRRPRKLVSITLTLAGFLFVMAHFIIAFF